jgi:hypothetical protein
MVGKPDHGKETLPDDAIQDSAPSRIELGEQVNIKLFPKA